MIENTIELIGEIDDSLELIGDASIGSEGSVTNYDYAINKPKINNVELVKNKTFEDLGMNKITNTELDEMFKDL